jgi:hypothetical protein
MRFKSMNHRKAPKTFVDATGFERRGRSGAALTTGDRVPAMARSASLVR